MKLQRKLLEFQRQEYMCDTVLVADDGQVKAHSVVLAAVSDVFNAAIRLQSIKPCERIVEFPGVTLSVLQAVVLFAYTGNISASNCRNVISEDVVEVLKQLGFDIPVFEPRFVI